MPVINVECQYHFMNLFYVYVMFTFSHIMYYVTFVLDARVCTKKRHSKYDSHYVWMFYQHVAGSLTWITTAVWTAPFSSLCFCSSKCQFCFLSHLTFHVLVSWEHVGSIFVPLKRCNLRWQSFKFTRDVSKPFGWKVTDIFGDGEVGCFVH